ncbi:hypothetical protein FACS1894163_06210 [Spirochaetia bacterium]|nr:hypothetical protein FACS1894163_06210 [Spirochaetia bacterium]
MKNNFSTWKPISLILLLSLSAAFVFAQEETGEEAEINEAPLTETSSPENDQRIYKIRKIDFDISGPKFSTGRSRPFALLNNGEFQEGERITGQENLEKFRLQKIQLLMNQRVLESVDIQYELGEAEADGAVPVDLLVIVRDSLNIIALPYPKIDTNSGLELTLKARDYNFLGTMNPLRVDLGYTRDENGKNSFNFIIDSDTPFKAFGFNWNLNFDHDFAWRPDEDSGHELYYKNTTGIAMELPVGFTTATFGFEEAFIVNENNTGNSNYDPGRDRAYENYASSELYVSWKIPTPLAVGPFGRLTYTPKLAGKVNYGLGEEIGYLQRGPSLSLSHSLGFGRINWIQNYRSGLEASLSNDNSYNFSRDDFDKSFTVSTAISATGHLPVTERFGMSGKLQYRQWWGWSNDEFDRQITTDPNAPPGTAYDSYPHNSNGAAGDVLRGIRNKDIKADWMISLNLDFPLRVWQFRPSQKPWMRYFNFEMHLSPILDMAILSSPDPETAPFQIAGGIEVVVFPAIMRSLYIRASLGYNLREVFATGFASGSSFNKLLSTEYAEFFFGLGHHY